MCVMYFVRQNELDIKTLNFSKLDTNFVIKQ